MAKDAGTDTAYDPKKGKLPKWLVMIYLAGDNNLSANTIAIMQELEDVLHSDDVRVVACFDPNTPRPRGARYVEINYRRKHHPNPHMKWELHDDLVPFECLPGHPVEAPDFCNPNPTPHQPQTEPVVKEGLSRFIEFALKNHPARKRMLILFGHGSAVAGNTFLADTTPPSFLRLKEFKEVLSRHFSADESARGDGARPPLDILACDNCMMNGIESAYEIRGQVKYVVGSQGLVLALGWPFRKILNKVVRHANDDAKRMAERILRVCARNLIDFSLMDRSSEQSLCDLTTLGDRKNLVTAAKGLSAALQKGLDYDRTTGKVKHPDICDAVRLARLEAQSYWSETFVDLYDFCALLLERSNRVLDTMHALVMQILLNRFATLPEGCDGTDADKDVDLRQLSPFKEFGEIADACWDVLEALRGEQDDSKKKKKPFVLASYYVGPELQYSNGVSVYFPWTLPDAPIIFEPVPGGGGGNYAVSWRDFSRAQKLLAEQFAARLAEGKGKPPENYQIKTAFDEYRDYDFAKCDGGDWAACLTAFFRATLRNVRLHDVKYEKVNRTSVYFDTGSFVEDERDFLIDPSPINLQKSSSDADSETDCTCPTIKNYPRRFYLSPADCLIKCRTPRGAGDSVDESADERTNGNDSKPCVSYLGWNIRGFVAEAIHLKKPKPNSSGAAENDFDEEPEEA